VAQVARGGGMTFVGCLKNLVGEGEFRELLKQFEAPKSLYFLRWPHKVSGFIHNLEGELSPEGQLITSNCELRWKQKIGKFDALLLSKDNVSSSNLSAFEAIGGDWQLEDHEAEIYGKNKYKNRDSETRFPKDFRNSASSMKQRYFIDCRTGTVHFVALTLDGST
jgi:hypothetical protein